ncbi:MAG TPA: hypothetical protein VJ731_05325 [Terriglobales bacterium]|nr:hypothetical protein [Terriglobales bacterium]
MKFTVLLFLCLPACAQTWFTNVTIKPAANSCSIGWTTAVPTIAHVEYGTAAGSYTKTNADSANYWRSKTELISGLTPSTTYHFKIVASDTSKNWITSLDYTCRTAKSQTAGAHSVKLNWRASTSGGVTGYQVYRSTISGGYFGLLGSVSGLAYTDQSVQSGKTYFYALKSVNSAGALSSFSNQVQAVIP